jgi:hypothetical protein
VLLHANPAVHDGSWSELIAVTEKMFIGRAPSRIQPSAPVLASLARVLRLDHDQRAYMNELAGTPAKSRRRAPQKVSLQTRRSRQGGGLRQRPRARLRALFHPPDCSYTPVARWLSSC